MGFFSNVVQLDHLISQQIVNYHSWAGDQIFFWITSLGDPAVIIILAAIFTVFWVIQNKDTALRLSGVSTLGSFISVSLIKNIIQRPRPEFENLIQATGFSFPSAHATVSMAFYGILAYLVGRNLQKSSWKRWLYLFAGLLIFAIGVSRIYWNVHYLSDVLCGWTLGSLWLWFSIQWLGGRKSSNSS